MQYVVGAFYAISSCDAQDAFVRECWHWLTQLPSPIRPQRAGNHEAFKPIAEVDVEKIIRDDYWVSRGKTLLASVQRPWSREGRLSSVTLLLELTKERESLCRKLYEQLLELGTPELRYSAECDQTMFSTNLALHKMLNSGLVEQNIDRARSFRELFTNFDERT